MPSSQPSSHGAVVDFTGAKVKPSSFVDALIDSANVIGFDNLALRRATEEADTKTLSEVIIATLVFGRPAAIIIGINVGPFLPACLRCYTLGSIAGELIGVWLEQQTGGFSINGTNSQSGGSLGRILSETNRLGDRLVRLSTGFEQVKDRWDNSLGP